MLWLAQCTGILLQTIITASRCAHFGWFSFCFKWQTQHLSARMCGCHNDATLWVELGSGPRTTCQRRSRFACSFLTSWTASVNATLDSKVGWHWRLTEGTLDGDKCLIFCPRHFFSHERGSWCWIGIDANARMRHFLLCCLSMIICIAWAHTRALSFSA